MGERYFKMWAKSGCPYCHDAQMVLLQNQMPHEVQIVDDNPALLTEVQDKYEWSTVPVIVERVDGEERFVGGYTDLVKHLQLDTPEAGS